MIHLLFKGLPLAFTIMTSFFLFDFDKESDLSQWKVVDDVVMGGKSAGRFYLNEQGHALFEGRVSTENNGGFSSVQYKFEKTTLNKHSKFILRVKGDGKRYQFRVKEGAQDRHSYVRNFQTTGQWQHVTIPFDQMRATFRGRALDMPNFSGGFLEQIGFLAGNKKTEAFHLEIDLIEVQ